MSAAGLAAYVIPPPVCIVCIREIDTARETHVLEADEYGGIVYLHLACVPGPM